MIDQFIASDLWLIVEWPLTVTIWSAWSLGITARGVERFLRFI